MTSIKARIEKHQIIVTFEPFDMSIPNILRSVPGYQYYKSDKSWRWQATPAAAGALADKLVRWAKYNAGVCDIQNIAELIFAKSINTIEIITPNILKYEPWQHQKKGYGLICHGRAVALHFDMGTGKTKCVIDAMTAGINARRVLIACPKSVISVWRSEFEKHCPAMLRENWNALMLYNGSVVSRTKELRNALAGSGSLLVVINYESAWREPFAAAVLDTEWDMIVCDEIHRIKDPKGKASKFFEKISPCAKYRVGLTGTPMPHSPMDIFAQYRFLDPAIFGRSFTRFRNRYAIMGGFEGRQIVDYINQDELSGKVKSISLRVDKNDVLDLPAVMHIDREVELGKDARKVYQSLFDTLEAEVQGGLVSASNALTKTLRLQQIVSGFAKTEQGDLVQLDFSKIDSLEELLSDLSADEPVSVFCNFRHDIHNVEVLCKKLNRKRVVVMGGRDEIGSVWNPIPGEVSVLQYKAGGLGIDLTAGRYCVLYSQTWNNGDYLQALARSDRYGQKKNVVYYHLIAASTVDVTVSRALQRKQDVVDAVMKYVNKDNICSLCETPLTLVNRGTGPGSDLCDTCCDDQYGH